MSAHQKCALSSVVWHCPGRDGQIGAPFPASFRVVRPCDWDPANGLWAWSMSITARPSTLGFPPPPLLRPRVEAEKACARLVSGWESAESALFCRVNWNHGAWTIMHFRVFFLLLLLFYFLKKHSNQPPLTSTQNT